MVRFLQTLNQSTLCPQFVAVYLSNMTNNTMEDEQREFIGVYRGLPDVWKVKRDGYTDRTKKDTVYKILVEKMKEINPRADRASVGAKINSFLSAYRREMKKVKESMKSGGGTDEVYVPSLWYFDELDFLRNLETQIQGISTTDETEFIEGNNETEVQFFYFFSIHTNTNSFFIQTIFYTNNSCSYKQLSEALWSG